MKAMRLGQPDGLAQFGNQTKPNRLLPCKAQNA